MRTLCTLILATAFSCSAFAGGLDSTGSKRATAAPAVSAPQAAVAPGTQSTTPFPVSLQSVLRKAESLVLTYQAPPGLSFTVLLGVHNASISPRSRSDTRDPTRRQLVADKYGKAHIYVPLVGNEGLLIPTVVLITDDVHTDVIRLDSPSLRYPAGR